MLTVNKLSKEVDLLPMSECAIETHNVWVIHLTPNVQLMFIVAQDMNLKVLGPTINITAALDLANPVN
jgi:hypothetical protein